MYNDLDEKEKKIVQKIFDKKIPMIIKKIIKNRKNPSYIINPSMI